MDDFGTRGRSQDRSGTTGSRASDARDGHLPAGAARARVGAAEEAVCACTVTGARRRVCQALETLLEGCAIIGRDWRYLYVNQAAAMHAQLLPAELIGRTIAEVHAGFESSSIFAAYQRCMEQRVPERFEAPLGLADGAPRWYLFSVEPVPEGIFVVSLDITERVHAEHELTRHRDHLGELVQARTAELEQVTERYRSLFSTMTEGFALHEIVCDAAGVPSDYRFLDLNPAFERLTGLERSKVVGKLVSEVLPGEDRRWVETYGKVALTGEPIHYEGFSTALGRHYEVLSYRPAPGQFAVVFLDATERKRMEQEREQHLAAVAEANQAKDLFFNTLSHELRTPLAAMLTSAEVLSNPEANDAQRTQVLRILERNVRHQARLIDDLLDLSRIMRGKVQITRQPLDLNDVVRAQSEAVEASAAASRVRLVTDLARQPVPISGDPQRLSQVVSNLLTNAIKFTDASGTVTVQTRIESEQAVVRVHDTGIGMTPELLGRIFEPFHQGESSLTRAKGGLGIGLAVARSLAELHGGQLQAESSGIGQGSRLTLRLPLHRAPPAAARVAPPPSLRTPAQRVLVVEDNADLRDTLAIMLRLLGHTAILAPTALAAMELACVERPDSALIDIGLPDIDGYELARMLRADDATRNIRLVALTGYATAEHRERALAAGFDHHLPKPAEQDDLRRVLAP
jgi:PAS domain S-box-containing protein